MIAKVVRFYGWCHNDVKQLVPSVLNRYIESMIRLEKEEQSVTLALMTAPHTDKDNQLKLQAKLKPEPFKSEGKKLKAMTGERLKQALALQKALDEGRR